MKIDCIFAEQLYAFRYEGEEDHEFNRLMELWTDVSYLRECAIKNKVTDIDVFVNQILKDAEEIDDFINELAKNNEPYTFYFQPLQDSEFGKILARQKGKKRKNNLRIYAIKIDDNCFVITGGAIKMSQKMQDHPDTAEELKKLNWAKDYLSDNGVFDSDSFFELIELEL